MPRGESGIRELGYKPTAAYSFRYNRDKPLYYMSSLPRGDALSKNSYYFLKNGEVYYINDDGKKELLDIEGGSFLKILHKRESESNVRRFLQSGCDFLIAEQTPENPIQLARQAKAKNPTAYIYSNNQLYYVDLRDNRYKKIDLSDEQIAHIHAQFDIPVLEPHEIKTTAMKKNQLLWVQQNILPPLDIKQAEQISLSDSLDQKDLNALWTLINKCKEHSLGQYKIYQAIIDPHDYPPNEGALLEGDHQSPYDDNDEDTILDMVKEALEDTLFKEAWLEEQKEFVLAETVKNPEIYSEIIEKAIEHFFHTESSSYHPGNMAMMQYQARKNLYNTTVIRPRLEMVFPLKNQVSTDDIRLHGQRGTVVGQSLALGKIPQSIAEVWIVTDQNAADVEKHGLHKETEIGEKGKSQAFVCFSEKDAKTLVKQLRANREFDLSLLNAKSVRFDQLDENKTVNKMVVKEYLEYLKPVLFVYLNGLLSLRASHDAYVRYMQQVNPQYLNSPEPMDVRLRARVSTDNYPHLERIDELQQQLKELIEIVVINLSEENINFVALNKQIQQFDESVKDYIRDYPFKYSDHSIIHHMFRSVEQLKQNIPHMVEDKREEYQAVMSKRSEAYSPGMFAKEKIGKKNEQQINTNIVRQPKKPAPK